jgi:hypothetical protein
LWLRSVFELIVFYLFLQKNDATHSREVLELMSASLQVQRSPSIAASKIVDAQWVAVRNGLLAQVEARKRQLALATAPGAAAGLAVSRFVPMVDVSGSMLGTPMNVAIVLGVLTSEMGKST